MRKACTTITPTKWRKKTFWEIFVLEYVEINDLLNTLEARNQISKYKKSERVQFTVPKIMRTKTCRRWRVGRIAGKVS